MSNGVGIVWRQDKKGPRALSLLGWNCHLEILDRCWYPKYGVGLDPCPCSSSALHLAPYTTSSAWVWVNSAENYLKSLPICRVRLVWFPSLTSKTKNSQLKSPREIPEQLPLGALLGSESIPHLTWERGRGAEPCSSLAQTHAAGFNPRVPPEPAHSACTKPTQIHLRVRVRPAGLCA